jgi:hypothetical protein
MTIVCATEGFVGVLFASMCSAVFFAKVSRIQSFAQVDFSDVVCIRYGIGIKDDDETHMGVSHRKFTEESSSVLHDDHVDTKFPCPILEFRLVNRMHSVPGGEIVDARVNVVASIDASNLTSIVPNVTGRHSHTRRRKRNGRRKQESVKRERPAYYHGLSERLATSLYDNPSSQNFDSLSSLEMNKNIPKTILTKLPCESLDHPFLKRAFTIRHRLDQHSPVLKVRPRLMVLQNNGFWPHELNNAESVRESIQFDQIIIRLTGVSNADANTVFSHTVYDIHDLRIGYQFTNMLYRCPRDGSLQIDSGLLNDISEQDGGGGEIIANQSDHKVRDVSRLL